MKYLFGLLMLAFVGCLPQEQVSESGQVVSILVRPIENGACLATEVLILDDQGDAYDLTEVPDVCNEGALELPPGRSFARVFASARLALIEVELLP